MNSKNNYIGKMNEETAFEVKKVFEFYYKYNNYTNVLKRYNKPVIRQIKILQKNRQKKRKDQTLMKGDSKN